MLNLSIVKGKIQLTGTSNTYESLITPVAPTTTKQTQRIINKLKENLPKTKLEFCQTLEYILYYYQKKQCADTKIQQLFAFYKPIIGNQELVAIINNIQKQLLTVKNSNKLNLLLEKIKEKYININKEPSSVIWFNLFKNLLKIAAIIAILVFVCFIPLSRATAPNTNSPSSSHAISTNSKALESYPTTNYNPALYYPASAQKFSRTPNEKTETKKNKQRIIAITNLDRNSICLKSDYLKASLHPISCKPITKEFIENFIIGQPSAAIIEQISQAVIQAQSIDPIIRDYINIVFNHLVGFNILALTAQEYRNLFKDGPLAQTGAGGYSPVTRTLILCYDLSPETILGLTIHEFRHALMNTIQISRAKSGLAFTSQCFFPLTQAEENKFASYLNNGDKKLEKIAELLELEKKNQLNNSQKNYLKKLRMLSTHTHSQYHYGSFRDTTIFNSLHEAQHMPIGHRLDSLRGMIEIIGYSEVNKKFHINVKIVDPIKSMVRCVTKDKLSIAEEYPPEAYLYEREAGLYETSPVPLIREIYCDLFNYGNSLIKETLFTHSNSLTVRNTIKISPKDDDFETNQNDILLTCTNEFLDKQSLKMILDAAKYFFISGINLTETEACLKTLIKNNFELGAANVMLAEIKYSDKKFIEAVDYYQTSFAKGLISKKQDYKLHYAESLFETEQYIQAEEICRQALNTNDKTLGSAKPEYEALLEKITTQQNNQGRMFKK